MSNVLGLTPSSDPAILRAVLSRLSGLYHTSRYAVDDDMVIDQLISRVCLVTASYITLMYIKFLRSNYFVLFIFVKSSNNKNIWLQK